MTHTTLKIIAAGLFLAAGSPVLAQDTTVDPATLTCAEFTALDATAQAAAITTLHEAAGATASEDAAADAAKLVTACEGKEDTLASEAMAAE